LKFNSDTVITEAQDTADIPFDNHTELFRIHDYDLLHQEHNFIGILLEIKPVNIIPREGKSLALQKMKIGDPQAGSIFDVTIWNKIVEIDMEMLNKTVVLRNFRVD
jgi:hypothetical protein